MQKREQDSGWLTALANNWEIVVSPQPWALLFSNVLQLYYNTVLIAEKDVVDSCDLELCGSCLNAYSLLFQRYKEKQGHVALENPSKSIEKPNKGKIKINNPIT